MQYEKPNLNMAIFSSFLFNSTMPNRVEQKPSLHGAD
jgi:hypothetical protein